MQTFRYLICLLPRVYSVFRHSFNKSPNTPLGRDNGMPSRSSRAPIESFALWYTHACIYVYCIPAI